MAVNTTGVTPAANFLPTIWASEVSDAVQANVVLADLVDRSYEDDMKFGKILAIQDMHNPAVRIKSEDTTATWSNLTETQQTITINRQAYVAFLVEDIAELQSKVDLRGKYSDKAGYSISAFVEGDATSGLASLPSGFTNGVGTLGIDPADDDLIRAMQYLDDADVPEEDRFWYVSPGYYAGLLKIDKFTRNNYVGDSGAQDAVRKGKVGDIYNAPVYKSTLTRANPNVSGQAYGWFCHKRGVALIMQRQPQIHTQYIMLETGWGVLVDTIYQFAKRSIGTKTLGAVTVNDNFNCYVAGP